MSLIRADARQIPLVDGCVQARRNRGQFQKGQHWRQRQPWWDAEWLRAEYLTRQRSAGEIARDHGVTDGAIYFWLKKHGITTRSVSEVRAFKRWGSCGIANPMYGKRGPFESKLERRVVARAATSLRFGGVACC